jgi:hypothetical protein
MAVGVILRSTCGDCRSELDRRRGDSFNAQVLHCDNCGRDRWVTHDEVDDFHLRHPKAWHIETGLTEAASCRCTESRCPDGPMVR